MDDWQIGIRVTFDGADPAQSNRTVQELCDALRETVGPGLGSAIEKEDTDTQDTGSTLALVFSSTATLAVAQGIRAYLARRSDRAHTIKITTADGTEVIATGDAARSLDAAALIRATRRAR
jgi:hypothetical protein